MAFGNEFEIIRADGSILTPPVSDITFDTLARALSYQKEKLWSGMRATIATGPQQGSIYLALLESTKAVDGVNVFPIAGVTPPDPGRWLLIAQAGTGSLPFDVEIPFTFEDGIVVIQDGIGAGGLVERCDVVIDTPFDGGGAYVTVGTVLHPSDVFAPGVVDVTTDGQSTSLDLLKGLFPDDLILTVNGGIAGTQGSGIVHASGRKG